MPYLKTETIEAKNEYGGWFIEKLKIHVDSGGQFYTTMPSRMVPLITDESNSFDRNYYFGLFDQVKSSKSNGEIVVKVYKSSLQCLLYALSKMLKDSAKPEVKEEFVIRYLIGSRASFALGVDGEIYPNASFGGGYENGVRWADDGIYSTMKGLTMSTYALEVGARALVKKTIKFGESERIVYEPYYKGASNHGHENPAQKLNSWANVHLSNNESDGVMEMPYSDEAALFFNDLMMSMVKLTKLMHDNLSDPHSVQLAIQNHSHSNPFLLGRSGAEQKASS